MSLGTFTYRYCRYIPEILQILMDDFSLIIRHRIKFAVNVALGNVDGLSSGNGFDFLVSVFLIVVDIDDDIDPLLESRIDSSLQDR